jgi:trehalose synthase
VARDIQRRSLGADVWFLHDPQLLPLAQLLPQGTGETRLWVCHIDLTNPNQSVMDKLLPLADAYHGLVFSLDTYVPQGLSEGLPVRIVPPAIDPLTAKNRPLASAEAAEIVGAMGIDPERPLVTQVSRFDHWKDPWGVVDAYRIARESIPGLQLALLGLSQAADDPEALDVLHQVTAHAADDPDIHLYFYPTGLPDSIDRIVNAFQVASAVVMQKSLREGFGLTVSEAMWKARPVIGGDVGGIRIQIQNGTNGYLVKSPQECAHRIVALLKDPDLSRSIGDAGREKVRSDFLLPRLALDYLRAARDLAPHHSNGNGTNGHHINGFESLERLYPEGPTGVRQPDPAPVRLQSR